MQLQFIGDLWYWRGPAPFHFVTVPDEECGAIEAASSLVTYGWGMIPAAVRIGATGWKTALWPKDGGYGKDPAAPHRSQARGEPLQQGRPVPYGRGLVRVQPRSSRRAPRAARQRRHTTCTPSACRPDSGWTSAQLTCGNRVRWDLLRASPQTVSLRPRSHAWTSPAG